MKRLLILALLLAACDPAAVAPSTTTSLAAPAPTSAVKIGTVKRVVDGDTVRIVLDGKEEPVRLIGVDTPETVDPRRPDGCYGKEASDYTKALLPPGTEVRLVRDISERDRTSSHRLLFYIYRASDGLFVNADLVREGFAIAKPYPPDVAHAGEFSTLEHQARTKKAGMWNAC